LWGDWADGEDAQTHLGTRHKTQDIVLCSLLRPLFALLWTSNCDISRQSPVQSQILEDGRRLGIWHFGFVVPQIILFHFLKNTKSRVFQKSKSPKVASSPTKSRVSGRIPWTNLVECRTWGCVGLGPKKCTINPTALGIHPGDHHTRAHTHTRTNPSGHRAQDKHKQVCSVLSGQENAFLGCLSSAFLSCVFCSRLLVWI
jgi:hypothetical protein